MKKIYSLIILATLVMCGCETDRTYLNGPDASTFPSSKAEVESGLFAAYAELRNGDNLILARTPFTGLEDNATDIGVGRVNVANFQSQLQSTLTPNGSGLTIMQKFYEGMLRVVSRCNLVLDNLDRVKNKMTEIELNQYKIELLLIRSFAFDFGCQYYGDFPYIDHSLGLNASYQRTPYAEVIDNILRDMDDDLIETLPIQYSRKDYGNSRLGRVGAYGLKARICLNWGKYEEAEKYATKAIELSQQGDYALTPYNTDFCGEDHTKGEPSAVNLFGFEGHQSSKEWIWTLEFNSAIPSNCHVAPYNFGPRNVGGCGYFGPTQQLVDSFQCIDGKNISESPLYDWQHPYKNRDPRLDLFIIRPGTRAFNIQFETADVYDPDNTNITKAASGDQFVMNYNTGKMMANSEANANKGSKGGYGANGPKGPGGYLWRKYLDIQDYLANNSSFSTKSVCTLPYPLMRLAELYLIRAEANIELGKNLTQAKADIEKIRCEKAHMPALTVTDQKGLRTALRYERMIELCNEGFRWFDIRRWDIAKVVVNRPIYAPGFNTPISNAKPTFDDNACADYTSKATFDGKPMNLRVYVEAKYISPKNDHFPIPEAEILGAHVAQNEGY